MRSAFSFCLASKNLNNKSYRRFWNVHCENLVRATQRIQTLSPKSGVPSGLTFIVGANISAGLEPQHRSYHWNPVAPQRRHLVRYHDTGAAVDVGPGASQPDLTVRWLGLPQAEGRAGARLQPAKLVQGRPQAAAGRRQALGSRNEVRSGAWSRRTKFVNFPSDRTCQWFNIRSASSFIDIQCP